MWKEDSNGRFSWANGLPGVDLPSGKGHLGALSTGAALLDRALAHVPPRLRHQAKHLLGWQGLMMTILFLHGLWVMAYLHAVGPGGLGMPLPGMQPWARLDATAAAADASSAGIVEPGIGMGRQLSAAAAPVRTCPVDVEWGKLAKDPNKGRAAVFTLYNIVFGGGERYLLSIVLVLQGMGYHVDVMVLPGNACTTREFLLKTAEGLRIRLDPAKVDVLVVGREGVQLQVPRDVYSVFFSLGNEKMPQVGGIGYVNFFMNQFPFDAYNWVKPIELEMLSSYDYVLLNSRYSYMWWHTYVTDGLYYPALRKHGALPLVEILHPPVDPFPPDSLDDLEAARKGSAKKKKGGMPQPWRLRSSGALFSGDATTLLSDKQSILARSTELVAEHDLFVSDRRELVAVTQLGTGLGAGNGGGGAGRRRHIALVGRFFEGRQSKGHNEAVEMFHGILPRLPPGTELHLVGNLMGGLEHATYLFNVMQQAVGLPVKFHVGVSSKDVEEVLHSTLVQWHLTGVGLVPGEDPASEEHFGISVAEGMSAGCIPVVLLRGGVGDIVQHGVNGFLGPELPHVSNLTLQVFNMTTAQQTAVRTRAIRDVTRFTHTTFAKKFKDMVQRGSYSKPLQHLVKETYDVVLSRTFELREDSGNVAVIFQPDRHYAFEYVVKNVLFHLANGEGEAWGLVVVHAHSNANFVKRAMEGVSGARLWEEADPAAVLASPRFWQHLDAKRVLLFTTDSLLLRGNLKEYLPYDYAAAPGCDPAARDPPSGGSGDSGPSGSSGLMASLESDLFPKPGRGLGVLSLRSVGAMRDLAQQMQRVTDTAGEDPTQARPALAALLDRVSGLTYSVPAPRDAYRFAVESPCPGLEANFTAPYGHPLHTLPFIPTGLQGTWYHFWGDSKRYRDLLKLLGMSVCGHA